ncbi:polysaccharide deacetylase family protein [Halostella salina]|uniref:polysaccharide deacetylase family protein n=1 Tax=Halostella salina TaxID=1547897 RepID=UPI000EF7EC18|nr:polysaccharide deacetylase family protein [Halostella salina]
MPDGNAGPDGGDGDAVPDGHEFALCLTHDVDRPYKTYQSIYYALQERPGYHLRTALPGRNPYWQFDEIRDLESDLGVRSAFYFLNEPHLFRDQPPREWLRPERWIQHLGRYDIESPAIADAIRGLDGDGWEVGLHGSYGSYRDPERLRHEKAVLEDVLGHPVVGGRQHYLNLDVPDTWRHHTEAGLRYDASLGSASEYGFRHGYDPVRPFDDEFVVFPLTAMEVALPDPGRSFDRAFDACEDLLFEAAANDAVMTVLWHPRFFNEDEFPGYCRLYRRLIERAQELSGWVGPPGQLYRTLAPADGDAAPPDEGIRRITKPRSDE